MIIEKVVDHVGVIYLDRPEKINALTLEMIEKIDHTLKKWETDYNIRAVMIDGTSKKGLCAGGDLKELYNEFLTSEDPDQRHGFYLAEFELDKYINNYPKPIISHWHGIVMGGGVGLSINADVVIVDETLNWAMPETSIGFAPDVGACKFISELDQGLGQYVGLLGASLQTYDAIKYGFADFAIKSSDYSKVTDELFEISREYEGDQLIEEFKTRASLYSYKPEISTIETRLDLIEKYFKQDSIEEVFASLSQGDDDFARESLDGLKRRPAFMLAYQFEKYFVCKNLSYDTVVDMDKKMMDYSIETGQMQEGIRAKMIDKDNNPDWAYKSIEEVPMDEVKDLLGIEKTYLLGIEKTYKERNF